MAGAQGRTGGGPSGRTVEYDRVDWTEVVHRAGPSGRLCAECFCQIAGGEAAAWPAGAVVVVCGKDPCASWRTTGRGVTCTPGARGARAGYPESYQSFAARPREVYGITLDSAPGFRGEWRPPHYQRAR